MKDNIVERQTCEGKGGSLRTNQMNFLLKDAVPLWGHILVPWPAILTTVSHIDTNIFVPWNTFRMMLFCVAPPLSVPRTTYGYYKLHSVY